MLRAMPGTLILCGTPIGNLDDVTSRLLDTLRSADVVFAEDTRRTSRLFARFGIETPLRSYFVGNEVRRSAELNRRLTAGETVALVTDAGMPAVSDPGVSAVETAVAAGAVITVVPGPSAVTTAVAVAGMGGDRFVFEGFLPRSGAERQRRIAAIAIETRPVVLFAATSRVGRDLAALSDSIAGDRPVVVARELTKLHEEVWRGRLSEAVDHWNSDGAAKGEFTIVIGPGPGGRRVDMADGLTRVDAEIAAGSKLSEAVRVVAAEVGLSRRDLYEAALRAKGDS
jgi:16S rRNA (cytidine1402-2'-O)-methyltransferase